MSFHTQREQAVDAARSLLARSGVKTLPIPVESIARQLGIAVQFIPLGDEMSGMAFIKDGASVIVANAIHHPNRRRFTIAHELAHHVLHSDYLMQNVHVDTAVLQRNQRSSTGTDVKEVEANAFAAELLMPQSFLRKFGKIDANDDLKIAEVARQFRVSVSAMAVRLETLQDS